MIKKPKAIIADDEEHLRLFLQRRLSEVWPDLDIIAMAKNGLEAVEIITTHSPDIAFLDIKMPGLSGIEVAGKTMGTCHVVFVTSHDEYAVDAFDREAIDYLLKPVTQERLKKTVARLKKKLHTNCNTNENLNTLMSNLLAHLPVPEKNTYLLWIKAQHGEDVRLISVDDVQCFKAADKYTQVFYSLGETLINTTIKTLAKELNPDTFWQIHRGTIVNVSKITRVSRSLTGRYLVKLDGIELPFTVSRTYSHLFKQM